MKRWSKILLFCLGALALISWDRVTKDLARERLMNREPVSYFHDTFRLEYVENTGAAMSMGDSLPKAASFWLLSILPLIVLAALFVYIVRQSKEMSLLKMLAFSLLIAGGIGNIIDRLAFDRHVTDFMNIGFNNIRTGIFNFADVFVTAGAICLLLLYAKNIRRA
ncbi:MAG TPA: signal peptidase II [Chitinophagaceae bacterium]|jgi:signal peptidase II